MVNTWKFFDVDLPMRPSMCWLALVIEKESIPLVFRCPRTKSAALRTAFNTYSFSSFQYALSISLSHKCTHIIYKIDR